jgi:hypothetical protein
MASCGCRYAGHRDNQAPQFRHRVRHARHPGFATGGVGRVARATRTGARGSPGTEGSNPALSFHRRHRIF